MSRQVSDRLRKVVVRSVAAGVVALGVGAMLLHSEPEPEREQPVGAETLVVSNPSAEPTNLIISANGNWRLFQTPGGWYRSNGATFSSIGLPPTQWTSNAVILNDGVVVVSSATEGGPPWWPQSLLWALVYEGGSWSTYGIGEVALGDVNLWMQTNGSTLVAVSKASGKVFSSVDIARTWADGGTIIAQQTSVRTVGNFMHVLTPQGYQRWSYLTRQVANPVIAYPGLTAGEFVAAQDSTSTVYLVDVRSNGLGMTLFRSLDAGMTWAAVIYNEPLPYRPAAGGGAVAMAAPRVESDGDLHIYGSTTENGVVVVYEYVWDLPSGGWLTPTRFVTGLSAGFLEVWPNARVDGTLVGTKADRWVTTAVGSPASYQSYSLVGAGVADPTATTAQSSNSMQVLGSVFGPVGAVDQSPNGAWMLVNGGDRLWRSQDGVSWEGAPLPSNAILTDFVVRNDGSIVGVGGVTSGSAGFRSQLHSYVYRSGLWRGPVTVGQGRQWNDAEVSLADNGTVLLAVTGGGATFWQESSVNPHWYESTSVATGGRIDVIGDIAHIVSQADRPFWIHGDPYYSRWSFTTKATLQFETPTGPTNWLRVPFHTRIVRTPGSTSQVWMVSGGSSLRLLRSLDHGATWDTDPTANEAMPSGLTATEFTVSSDGRVHAYAQAACSNATILVSTSRALGAQNGFTEVVPHFVDETKTASLLDAPMGGSGVTGPGPQVWFTRSEPGAGFVHVSTAPTVSIESVYGMDPFGVSVGGVNSAIGSFSTSVVDAKVASVGPELSVSRTYNSADQRVGIFGRGWSTNLESQVFENCVTGDAIVLLGDGARMPFRNTGSALVPAPGVTSTLVKTGAGWTLTSRDGVVHTFDVNGRISSVTDADGRAKVYGRNGSAQLTSITDAVSGRAITLSYTGALVTSIETSPVTQGGTTAPLRWNLAYNGNELSRVCEPRNNDLTTGFCTTYTMTNGQLTQITDPNGNADQVVGYAGGKVAWQENGAGDRVTFTYNGLQTQVTDELGRTTTHVFDDRYRLVTETNARNGTTTHEYNADGYRWRTTDPNSLVTTRTFDANGNVLSERNGNNETTRYTYDAFNNRLTVRDGRSASATDNTFVVRTTWSGATRRRLTERTPATAQQPTGTLRTWGYTDGSEPAIGGGVMPAGLLETVTDPNGHVETYRYDSRGDLRETTSSLGLLTTFTYDQLGRKLTETSFPTGFSTGVTTGFAYDGLGNVVRTEGPSVTNTVSNLTRRELTVTTFDPAGNPVSTVVSDVGGSASPDATRTTLRTFDAADRPLTVTDPEGGVITNAYDVAGNLVQVTDARGVVRQFGFDANNMPTSEVVVAAVTDPGAAAPRNVTMWTKVYDTAGRLTSSTDALGRTVQFAYDNANRQTSTTLLGFDNRNGTLRNIVLEWVTFDAAGNPITKATGNGLRAESFTYDQAGRLVSSTLDPTGLNRVTTLVYDRNGNVLSRTVSANGRTEQTRFTYNAANLPLTQTVENGTVDLVTRFGYDNRGLQTSTIEPRGNLAGATAANFRTDISYDQLGRQIRVQSPSVSVTTVNTGTGVATTTSLRPTVTTGYNTFGDQTHRRDERANTTVQSFDRLGRVVTITHPSYTPPGGTAIVPTEQMVYDANGNLTSKTDRRGEVTTWQFDGLNRATRQTDPQVGTNPAGFSTVVYDDAGNQLVTTDQRGARIEFTYDDLNRVRTEVRVVRNATPTPSRFTTTFDYDDLGNVTYQQTPTGDVSTAVFNAASEMTSSTDPGLFTTTYVRDVAGRVTRQTDPLGRLAETDYDLAGRAITVRNFDAAGVLMTTRTSGYDAAGNPTSYVSPRGNVAGATAAHFTTTVTYDALSRVTSVTEPTSATTSITASYAYDAAGNISRLTDGRNNETLYAYQAWNLQSTVIEPSTTAHSALAQRRWTTSFDAGGLPVRLVEPGPVTVNRVFDDLGRLTSETGSGTGAVSATRTMGYDPAGLMTSVNAPGGAISFTYDDRRLLTGSDGPATALDSSFTYDASGRLLSRTDASGASAFTWNSRSLLATATNPLIAVTATHSYDAAGQRISTSYTGGGTRSYSFDGLGRITNDTLRNTTNTVTAAFDIGYDPDSNIVRRTISLPGNSQQGVHTYGYDNVGRITSWTRPGVAAVPYAWDGSGNLTNHAGVVQTFDQRNRILTSGSTVWTWSPRGTMATQQVGTAAATTLAFDGLNRMTASSGQAFAYDGLGRVVTNGATAFSYAGFEIDPVAVGTTLIARGPAGEPVSARIGTAAATMLGVDTHQDVTYRFAGAGTVSATRLYEPFGRSTVTSGTMPVIGFQGDYTNPTTGDVWMGARWYKPGTGSFTARDTVFGRLDTPISLNRYTYAWADPLGMWDPDGRCAADNGDDRGRCSEQRRAAEKHRKAVPRGSGGPGAEPAIRPAVIGGRESHSRDRSESVESCETDVSRCGPSWGLAVGGVGAGVSASPLVAAAAPYIAAAAVGVAVGCALSSCVEAIKEARALNNELEANEAWVRNYIQQAVNEGSMPPGVYGGRSYEREGDDQPGTSTEATRQVEGVFGTAKPWDLQRTETLSGRKSQAKVDAIAASMRDKGWVGEPVEVFMAYGQTYIVDGHHRVAAARQAGIDVRYRVISEEELLTYYPGGFKELVSAAVEARPGRVR